MKELNCPNCHEPIRNNGNGEPEAFCLHCSFKFNPTRRRFPLIWIFFFIILIAGLVLSSNFPTVLYSDNHITIFRPIHYLDVKMYGDGGTERWVLLDAFFRKFELFLDRRMGNKDNDRDRGWAHFYPGEPGSFLLEKQDEFRKYVVPFIESKKREWELSVF